MPVAGWNQPYPVWCVLSVMSFQWSFCSLTRKIVSFWLGRQPYHLFGPVFSEPWTRDPLIPPPPSTSQHPKGSGVNCLVLGRTLLTNHRLAVATRHCPGGTQASLALLARSSWLDLVSRWVGESMRAAVGSWEQKCLLHSLRMAVTACEMERDSLRRGDAGTVLGGELGKQERSPEMVCEEPGGRGNPAAFPLPFQSLPSPIAVASPQPCSRISWSGGASQSCLKAKVSGADRGAGGLWVGDNECWGLLCQQVAAGADSREAGSRGERWGEEGFPANSLVGGEGQVNDVLEGRVAANANKIEGTAYSSTGKVNNGAIIKVQL